MLSVKFVQVISTRARCGTPSSSLSRWWSSGTCWTTPLWATATTTLTTRQTGVSKQTVSEWDWLQQPVTGEKLISPSKLHFFSVDNFTFVKMQSGKDKNATPYWILSPNLLYKCLSPWLSSWTNVETRR